MKGLISTPLPEDVILCAVPMCAPYSSFKVSRCNICLILQLRCIVLQNFKFKMKLTHGTLKKGKVAKQAQSLFCQMQDCTPAERTAICGLNVPEITAALIGEVKISMPGLQALQKQQKTDSKRGKNKR